MWQKSKQFLSRLLPGGSTTSIYIRLVGLYSFLVSCILLMTVLITLGSLHFMIQAQIKQIMENSAQNVTDYLNTYQKIDSSVFRRVNLTQSVYLQVYNSKGVLIVDNYPTYEVSQFWDTHINQYINGSLSKEDLFGTVLPDTHNRYCYYTTWTDPATKSLYFLRFSRFSSHEADFISLLSNQLLFTIIISLFITILSGMYMTKKALAPLKIMQDTMKNIEVTSLGQRISLPDSHDEVHELADTINKTLDRIEYGYKQQQQFVSDASHELRTPITVISGYVDMLERWGKQDPEILNESISAIKAETESMRELIERLLYFARSTKGSLQMKFRKIDTEALLKEIYTETCLIAGNREIVLETTEKHQIYAEPGSVKQMMRIFIDNALKYTTDSGIIYLSCRKVNDKICFSVRDTGIGIPEEDLQRVFERFYRIDSSRTKSTGGNGLGLSIAKSIADANHAQLSLKSKVNIGTTVTVSFDPAEPSGKTE